jgi:mono/diheme cytochrome c family protein
MFTKRVHPRVPDAEGRFEMNVVILRRLTALLALLALLLLSLAAVESLAQSVSNGQTLFQQYCQPCHGNPPAGGAAGAGNNPGMIRTAINGKVPDMRQLSFLSNANLADIAAWIASLSAPRPDRDYTDLWWNPAESGWGLNLIQHPSNKLFGVMYTYDANGHPIWFVLPDGNWITSSTYTGIWYRVTGKPYNQTWAPSDVRPVGNATLVFTDGSNGTITYDVNGTRVSKSISRQPF